MGASPEAIASFQHLKMRKKDPQLYNFNVMQFNDKCDTIVPYINGYASFAQLKKLMLTELKSTPCFIVYDYQYELNGPKKTKILLLTWVPESSPQKLKMSVASSKDSLTKQFDGIARAVHCADEKDLEEKRITD